MYETSEPSVKGTSLLYKLALIVLPCIALVSLGVGAMFLYSFIPYDALQTSFTSSVTPNCTSNMNSTPMGFLEGIDVHRQKGATEATSFYRTIAQFETIYKDKISSECSSYGGLTLIDELRKSNQPICRGNSNIIFKSASDQRFFIADNVMLDQTEFNEERSVKVKISADCAFNSTFPFQPSDMAHEYESRSLQCKNVIEHPVLLIGVGDWWNYWFFLSGLFKQFLFISAVQDQINYDNLQIFFLGNVNGGDAPNQYGQHFPFSDALNMLLGDNKHKMVQLFKQSTKIPPNTCFKRLLWAPNFSSPNILQNRRHTFSKCVLSTLLAFRALLRASMHIPEIPLPKLPRVVWIGRDTDESASRTPWQKQRIIKNQDEIISYLSSKCADRGIEFEAARFYGNNSRTPFQEQAHFISRSNILIGIHGAGLNMLFFAPPGSFVVELHLGTSANQNSVNSAAHLLGKAFEVNASRFTKSRIMDQDRVWEELKKAIDEWIS